MPPCLISLPDCVKVWLASVNPFLRKFYFKVTHCWFELWRHSMANCGRRTVRIMGMSQWRAYRKLPSLFQMVYLTPYDLPFPQIGVPNKPPRPSSRRVLPPSECDRRYRQAVCCTGCYYEPNDIAFCQITLALVKIQTMSKNLKGLFPKPVKSIVV